MELQFHPGSCQNKFVKLVDLVGFIIKKKDIHILSIKPHNISDFKKLRIMRRMVNDYAEVVEQLKIYIPIQ